MKNKNTNSVLFVCSANQCRSPMAEALLCNHLEDEGQNPEKWRIASAGCWAYPEIPATQKAVETVASIGCDLSSHSSQAVSDKLLKDFNLILCMEKEHVDFIYRHFQGNDKKVFLLSEMIEEDFEIEDPVGRSLEDYKKTATQLLNIIKSGFGNISRLSGK